MSLSSSENSEIESRRGHGVTFSKLLHLTLVLTDAVSGYRTGGDGNLYNCCLGEPIVHASTKQTSA